MSEELTRRDAARLIGLTLAPASLDGSSVERKTTPDFSGRALVVYTSIHPLECPLILTDCVLEEQAGRLFLTGTNQPCRPNLTEWADGTRRSVAWDAVAEYITFDSLADYHSHQ